MKKGMNIPDILDHRSATFNTENFDDCDAEEIEHAVLA
jgi:hypothetical protein